MGGRGQSSRSSQTSVVGGSVVIKEPGTLGLKPDQAYNMTDDEFNTALKSSFGVDMPNFMLNADSQRFIYAAGINGLPEVVDDATFDQRFGTGTILYRTVNEFRDTRNGVYMSATDITDQFKEGDLSRIGNGVYGDGYYFADRRGSSEAYGYTSGNIKKTAVMRAALNDKARVIDHSTLVNSMNQEIQSGSALGKTLRGMDSDSAKTAFAIHKGYNVIKTSVGYYNILDRSAVTMSKKVTARS